MIPCLTFKIIFTVNHGTLAGRGFAQDIEERKTRIILPGSTFSVQFDLMTFSVKMKAP